MNLSERVSECQPARAAWHSDPPEDQARASMEARVATVEEIRRAGATISVELAARALRLSRSTAYLLIKSGDWPTPLIRVGPRRIRVPQAAMLRLLEVPEYKDSNKESA